MATITLERPNVHLSNPETPRPAEFRAASRDNDDLAVLFDAVDAEDARRAIEADRLLSVRQATGLCNSIALIHDEILADAEGELRVWVHNLVMTLDANSERIAGLSAEMREAGLTVGETGFLFESTATSVDFTQQLLARVAEDAAL